MFFNEVHGYSSESFTIINNYPKKISQIDSQNIGDSYSVTLYFKEDFSRSLTLWTGRMQIREDRLETFLWEIRGLKTKVTSPGRALTVKVPKSPALGFFNSKYPNGGRLFCPGLVLEIPRAFDIHVAVIDILAASLIIHVDKHTLNVRGATLRLEADSELRFTLSIHDSSAAKEFRVELERKGLYGFRELLASSRAWTVAGSWGPAKPSNKLVIAGRSDSFSGSPARLWTAFGVKSNVPFAVGDPAPKTKYKVRLVGHRDRWRRDRVDSAVITFGVHNLQAKVK